MIDLKKIEERCKDATEGPWLNIEGTDDPTDAGYIYSNTKAVVSADYGYDLDIKEEDWAFIVHARTDIPALVDWVKRAAKLIEEAPTSSDAQTKARRELLSELGAA